MIRRPLSAPSRVLWLFLCATPTPMANINTVALSGPPITVSNKYGIPLTNCSSGVHSITQWINARQRIAAHFASSISFCLPQFIAESPYKLSFICKLHPPLQSLFIVYMSKDNKRLTKCKRICQPFVVLLSL